MVGNTRQGWALWAMLFILIVAFGVLQWAEVQRQSAAAKLGVQGIYMEGKEVRFGLAGVPLHRLHHRHLLWRGLPCTTLSPRSAA